MVITTSTDKGSATRELILARAYELAQEGGVEGLSIGTVAISAGMSKSGVFAHFGSKEQLQLALLESVAARFVEFVQAPALREPRGLPRLLKLTERWCEWSRAHRSGCVLLSAAVEYDGRREGAIREVEEECGIVVSSIGARICKTYHTYTNRGEIVRKRTYWYQMGYKGSGKLKPQKEEGITSVRWFRKGHIDAIIKNTFPSIMDVLAKMDLFTEKPVPLSE